MYEAYLAVYIGLCIWILFFGGVDKLENTFLGHGEFGAAGEKSWAIRMLTWIFLSIIAAFFIVKVFS